MLKAVGSGPGRSDDYNSSRVALYSLLSKFKPVDSGGLSRPDLCKLPMAMKLCKLLVLSKKYN